MFPPRTRWTNLLMALSSVHRAYECRSPSGRNDGFDEKNGTCLEGEERDVSLAKYPKRDGWFEPDHFWCLPIRWTASWILGPYRAVWESRCSGTFKIAGTLSFLFAHRKSASPRYSDIFSQINFQGVVAKQYALPKLRTWHLKAAKMFPQSGLNGTIFPVALLVKRVSKYKREAAVF